MGASSCGILKQVAPAGAPKLLHFLYASSAALCVNGVGYNGNRVFA